jgi:hypothetical protein
MQYQGTHVISFDLNGKTTEVTTTLDTPFLWVVRDQLKLEGSKFGCVMGLCSATSLPAQVYYHWPPFNDEKSPLLKALVTLTCYRHFKRQGLEPP